MRMALTSAPARAPSVPAGVQVSSQARQEFQQLKSELSDIASWELAPNTWDRIKMAFSETGDESLAGTFVAVLK